MKDLFLTLPPFAPDYGGACEVMYELNGLVLIHDASGCTVNYVSFDEPRWHTRPGSVFTSGLTEIDAVMGNDDVLIDKALKAAEVLHPNFIAYVGSSVPMIVGTDFTGIARETEERSGIPSFGFDCNGIHSYIKGASDALLALTKRFCGSKTKSKGTLVLGLIPMDDNSIDTSREILKLFPDLKCCLSFDTDFDTFCDAQNAEKIVVVSRTGLATAIFLNKKYGIPYSIGLPFKKYEKQHGSVLVIGEDVRATSLAEALGNAEALDLFSTKGLARWHTIDEEEIRNIASGFVNVIADPVFKPLLSSRTNFIPMPTVSVSGGIFKETIRITDVDEIGDRLIGESE